LAKQLSRYLFETQFGIVRRRAAELSKHFGLFKGEFERLFFFLMESPHFRIKMRQRQESGFYTCFWLAEGRRSIFGVKVRVNLLAGMLDERFLADLAIRS